MIPCAGFGTRMGDYTKSLPKPLLPVNDIPLLFYSLFLLHLWNTELCVINLHYCGDHIRKALKGFPWFPVQFSEEPVILGTSGGIRQAVETTDLDGWCLLMNPDTIFWPTVDPFDEVRTLIEEQRICEPGILLYISLKPPGNTERGFHPASAFSDGIPCAPLMMGTGDWFYSGLSVLHTDILSNLRPGEPHELRDVFSRESGQRLFGRPFPPSGRRQDCGTAEEYALFKRVDPIPPHLKENWKAFLAPLDL